MWLIIVIILILVLFSKGGSKPQNHTNPIDKAMDHLENGEDLDLEDLFILDEIFGDDE